MVTIQTKTVYKAKDGRTFDSLQQAHDHELSCDLLALFTEEHKHAIPPAWASGAAKVIMENAEAFFAVLEKARSAAKSEGLEDWGGANVAPRSYRKKVVDETPSTD